MITSKPQVIGSALRPTVHAQLVQSPQITPYVPVAPAPFHYRIGKRCFDLAAAGLMVLLLSPILLLISIAIKLEDGGPAIITQRRVGRSGEVYGFLKFRSMTVGIDHTQSSREFAQAVIRGEITKGATSNGGLLKPASNGPVITRVGRLLRKTSLDELPQLFNVLIGNMSLVGPRPSIDYEAEVYYDWYLPRLSVLPGITGLAQINGRSSISFPEIVAWDIKYIEERSLWGDIKILFKTIPVVIGMRHTG